MDERAYYELPLLTDLAMGTGVRVVRDLPYAAEGEDGPRLDLYLPAGEAGAEGFPLLIFLHGGPITAGEGRPWPKEWRVFEEYGRIAAGMGMAAAVPNVRFLGYEGLAGALGDVLQAIAFLEAEGEGYGLDLERAAVWAFSGAGMLLRPLLEVGPLPGLRAVVAFYPLLDVTHVETALEVFSEEELIAFSPLSVVESMRPQVGLFVARAGRDGPGLNRAVDSFVQRVLFSNRPLELHNVPGAGHGFDMFDDSVGTRATVGHGFRFVAARLFVA